MRVADEAWIAVALLHREQPNRPGFRVSEIMERARNEPLMNPVRPGVQHHVNWHAVANKAPQPGRHRYLYDLGGGQRRLYRPGDDFHPERETGKTVPLRGDLIADYRHLVDWYDKDYLRRGPPTATLAEPAAKYEAWVETPSAFEASARRALSDLLGVSLAPGTVPGVPKLFDYVSPDRGVVGDAKYFTLVRGVAPPPAKFSIIAEHVWLLEKTKALTKVLVFGNDRAVPTTWLKRYGRLIDDVRFLFLHADGRLEDLTAEQDDDPGWSGLSSSAFARDWESDEDSVYDNLPAR